MEKKNKILLIIIFIIIVLGIIIYIRINNKTTNEITSQQSINKSTSENIPNNKKIKNKNYSIKNKDFYLYKDINDIKEEYRGIKLLEYDNTNNNYAEIYYVSYDYTTDPSFYYVLKITFDEMIKLCNGLTIEKDGIKYTKESFEKSTEMPMIKDKNVEIGNKINAIKYYFELNNEDEYYMFIYKDNIYSIRIPTNNRVKDEVQLFL